MSFLLDTDICVELLRRNPPTLRRRLDVESRETVFVSAITIAELQYGVQRSADPERNLRSVLAFCSSFSIAEFDDHAAMAYGQVRFDLERRGTPIGPLDTLIAAHALSLKSTLVSNNIREFARVSNLRCENWLK